MPATVEVHIFHGAAPGLGSDVTLQTVRFKQADDDVQDALSPVPVPLEGYAYSWRKSFKLVATTAPDNRISNLRFFSDGASLGTGRTVLFGRSSSYVQASAGDQAGGISSTDVDLLTSSSPETIQGGTVMDSGDAYPYDGGAAQDYVMLQLRHDVNVVAGDAAAAKTLTYRFDET